MGRRWPQLTAVAVAGLLSQPARSETPPAKTVDPEVVQRLMERVDAQEAEIRALKAKLAQGTPVNPAPPAEGDGVNQRLAKQDAEIQAIKTKVAEAAARESGGETTFPTLSFHGFGDVDYRVNDVHGDKNTFVLGQFDAFLTSQLAEDVSVLNETVIEANDENHFNIEIERLLLQLRISDSLNIDIGRYHTNVGYYNTAYHHGTWFQTAVGRPAFLDFEDGGGIIPSHNVGVSIHGAVPVAPKLGLTYYLEVGNGRYYRAPGVESHLVLNVQDNNAYKAVNLAVTSRPESMPGWQFGMGVYHDTIAQDNLARTDETMIHGHVVYREQAWEFLSEGYFILHSPRNVGTRMSSAAFVQLARRFGKFTPYARFSYLNAASDDAIYQLIGQAGRHYTPGVGIRWDFTNFAAFKAEYDFSSDAGVNSNELTLQACFTF